MNLQPVARRYAQALYREAAHEPLIDEDVDVIRESLAASRELTLCMKSPVLSSEKKLAVAEALFAHRTHPVTMRFLRLVTDRKREALLSDILQAYCDLRTTQQGIATAHVRTAVPLSPDEKTRLQKQLEQQTGKRIHLVTKQDADIIGGLIIRIGDVVQDGSVRHHLARLRTQLQAEA